MNKALALADPLREAYRFTSAILRLTFSFQWISSQLSVQIYNVGVRSLSTTLVAGVFVGAIMAIQIHVQLKDFGAAVFLGGLSTSVTIRNVGPVLIAFVLSGKVGAFTSAELGTMRVTDQIDAIRCLGMDPLKYLVVQRFVAVVISSFLLLIVGLMITIFGGMFMASFVLGVNPELYLQQVPNMVSAISVIIGMVKSFFFGGIIALVCCHQGYHTKGGAAGVGRAVRRTAVLTLVLIIVADYGLSILGDWVETALEAMSL